MKIFERQWFPCKWEPVLYAATLAVIVGGMYADAHPHPMRHVDQPCFNQVPAYRHGVESLTVFDGALGCGALGGGN